MVAPFKRISPSVGSSKPAISRNVVVFPQPDGPSSAKNSPFSILSETPLTAAWVAKCFETSRSSRTAFIGRSGCSYSRFIRGDWQMTGSPGIESAGNIHHLLEPGPLQQAGRDRAAITALAVHCNRFRLVQ